jgi:hypothetical protein
MNLEGRQKIVSIAIVPHEEIDDSLPEDYDEEQGEDNLGDASVDTSLPSNGDEE